MRRSKSNPAKYARNYKCISQRRMTHYDNVDEVKEMERLRLILKTSEEHLQQHAVPDDTTKKRSYTETRPLESHVFASSIVPGDERTEQPAYGEEDTLDILPPKEKKIKTTSTVELTPQEIRQAKLLQKNTARKLKQLLDRAEQKKKRTELYAKLEENAISEEERQLLVSSSTLGKRETKRGTLKRLLQRERAGLTLSNEEKDLLYPERQAVDIGHSEGLLGTASPRTMHAAHETNNGDTTDDETKRTNKSKKKKQKQSRDSAKGIGATSSQDVDTFERYDDGAGSMNASLDDNSRARAHDGEELDDSSHPPAVEAGGECESYPADSELLVQQHDSPESSTTIMDEKSPDAATPLDFAAQMMASLSSLKGKSNAQKDVQNKNEAEKAARLEAQRLEEEERQRLERKRYIPTEPAALKTAAAIGLEQKHAPKRGRRVLEVNRPAEIQVARYDLPVSGMEFEIVDAIRNNDVTIICAETGSGKSTQAPQFLYEAGFTWNESADKGDLLIGVTQPRRVAAISTAKRVCHEMGHGDGHKIRNGSSGAGNLVAYQTRYESGGLGHDTRIKFMTDGILLQEIQSDLLLRKYGAIILDEAHERNLNTDVLLGLLSVAVPLRRKASLEEGPNIGPLKLVIMSATLRVEDFTENTRLFPNKGPALVQVPGRTHPVTIHHSKVTELDDYETVTFNKVCKIHRKLPKGGILVFMTGKQEIIRMVNRLRRALGHKRHSDGEKTGKVTGSLDVCMRNDANLETAPRDLDDEEIDGDIFEDDVHDDFDDAQSESDEEADEKTGSSQELDDSVPKQVLVLPLYSMLSADEQTRVFDKVPDGVRLIVVATNIAETSITIPDVSYVVDTGRQKCRNYHAATGVASYDVMWISRAAADQRAGRAGRTGPGHCYRMYSSSMYARHMNAFALPEVLTRPLEDVVLAMKAMNVSSVTKFPFPTAPNQTQLDGALRLLANIGCVDLSNAEKRGGDGQITRLGAAVAKLPLGVRYGKMLLVAAQAGVLDYAIAMVAVQSESSSPFQQDERPDSNKDGDENSTSEDDSFDAVDRNSAQKKEEERRRCRWTHRGGDILAAVHAVGAYTYAGRGAGGVSEKLACRRFCEENGLSIVVMERIQKMRIHLARLARTRLSSASGIASKTGGILSSMPPPSKLQEILLIQAIASGLLDNVAMIAPPGSHTGGHPYSLRSAYISCCSTLQEPLFVDRNSVVFSRDSRKLPKWICYDTVVRKKTRSGDMVVTMKNITPIDPVWLGTLAKGSCMLSLGQPLPTPLPSYDKEKDAILCSVSTKFGTRGWEIPPVQVEMFDVLQQPEAKKNGHFMTDDSFRWFARFLLEGKVVPELAGVLSMLNEEPSGITRKRPLKKVALFVSALSSAGVDSAAALRKHWAQVDDKFLFRHLKKWTKEEYNDEVKRIWIAAVKENINQWNEDEQAK